MNLQDYFESLATECGALKNRVRNFINDQHWLTDGEWKETVLRSMINRSIPNNISVGRGFVVTQNECSTQIDILLYDNNLPVLYRDGDLVFIPPRSCRGIIEVKSNVRLGGLRNTLKKLSNNSELILNREPELDLFVGLFSFDTTYTEKHHDNILEAVLSSSANNKRRIVNHLCLGQSLFIKYWENGPNYDQENYDTWHAYKLTNISVGYFLHNLLSYMANRNLIGNDNIWFPVEGKENNGKENRKIGVKSLNIAQ